MSTIQKWGNSLAIRIPQAIAGQLDFTEGTACDFQVREGELIIRHSTVRRLSLGELLKSCKKSQLHTETDFGSDVGREVID